MSIRLQPFQEGFALPVSARFAIGTVSLLPRVLTGKNIDSGPKTGRFRRILRSCAAENNAITAGYPAQIGLSLLFGGTGY
ncbi:hypothetical protein GRI89_17320 [Altererythrobacter salegens]|uniref:Uncharacterized protein n=1 Tax=Croceibacterium salegens TaxID=1737568 RepID=A0A6I4T1G1_9SPHN|nr:hypothetical protein [Croceibacterium salegens]MXO61308.1 hypothetical protein [Croceibacterium salegens]